MAKERIETGKAVVIKVANCSGDLVIRPWMELAVQADGNYEITETDGKLIFQASGDLRLLVPVESTLIVDKVQGDLLIKGVRGTVELGEIDGDAALQNLSCLSITTVHGDLSAKNLMDPLVVESVYGDALARSIDGDVKINNIYGDLAAYYINGDVKLGQCMGDINMRTVSGRVAIESGYRDVNLRNLGSICSVKDIHGDIRLKGGLSSGEHLFQALGDIVVRWPLDAPLQLVAQAAEIQNRLPLVDVKQVDNSLIGRLGDGDTAVTLNAKGRISLKEGQMINEEWESDQKEDFDMDFMIDLSGLGERISAEVSQSMASLTKELENSFGPEFAQNISAKVSQKAEKAARQAEAAAEKARKYAEREAVRAQKYQNRSPYSPPSKPTSTADVPRVSSEEHLKILRMVENGTITPDEAATLLDALE